MGALAGSYKGSTRGLGGNRVLGLGLRFEGTFGWLGGLRGSVKASSPYFLNTKIPIVTFLTLKSTNPKRSNPQKHQILPRSSANFKPP